ncbi:P-loop containing nucleoside triphosphate hydrolase protein [Clavulina sp. PMI_390]|nr:P-loop containing nucleoside triphosphate hydrolase protein [Clavulina sp. PMI_390]
MSLAPSLHARARALLRSTTESFGVVGRAKERKFITDFLQPFVDGTSSSRRKSEDTTLYISGSPGTGKTALVSSIVSGMTGDDVRTAYINCMGLKDINVLWGRVLPALGETSTSAKGKASTSNWNRFEKKLKEASFKCVLVLDELDAFGASALSTIFGLPARFPASLRIIAISNDLTQSINSPTLSIHRPSLTLAFTAYDAAEMQEIIRGRLALLCDDDEAVRHDEKATAAVIAKVIQPAALTLLVKKVSSQTGDIRHALEVLRRALDLAAPMTNILEDPIPPSPIGMKHVIDAVKRTPKNAVASASTGAFPSGPARPANALDNSIASLSLQARFVLIGILLARRRTAHDLPLDTLSASSSFSFSLPTPGSTPCTPTKPKMRRATSSFGSDAPLSPSKVYSLYSSILRASASAPLDPVSRNEYTDLLGVLETASLISVPTISSPSPTKLKRGPARKSASFGSGLSGSLKVREDAGSLVLIPGEDDVLRALLDSANGGVLDAEITKTWERETKRIEKAIASRAEAALAEPPVSRDELL